jgi:hypothetical protein
LAALGFGAVISVVLFISPIALKWIDFQNPDPSRLVAFGVISFTGIVLLIGGPPEWLWRRVRCSECSHPLLRPQDAPFILATRRCPSCLQPVLESGVESPMRDTAETNSRRLDPADVQSLETRLQQAGKRISTATALGMTGFLMLLFVLVGAVKLLSDYVPLDWEPFVIAWGSTAACGVAAIPSYVLFRRLRRERAQGEVLACPSCKSRVRNPSLVLATGCCVDCGLPILGSAPPRIVEAGERDGQWSLAELRKSGTPADEFTELPHRTTALCLGWLALVALPLLAATSMSDANWIQKTLRYGLGIWFIGVCLMFGFILMRSVRSQRTLSRCPHCRGELTSLRDLVITTGRCGHCGRALLSSISRDELR